MSTIKIGDKVVQFTDRSGAIRGGIDDRSRLDKNPNRSKSDQQIIEQQTKNIEGIEKIFKNQDDARGKFLALQTPKALLNKAQFRKNQAALRRKVFEDFVSGKNVDRSLFTGREPKPGTKNSILTAFGIGTVPTGKAKLREGLSSEEYAKYMRDLYDANPGMMESLFPFSSGKTLRNVSRLAPGIGTLQNLASAAKEKTGSFLNRFFPGLLPSSGIATTKQAQPTLTDLNENAFRFASFRNAPTNIKDIKADNEKRDFGFYADQDFEKLMDQMQAVKLFSGFPGTEEQVGKFMTFYGTPLVRSDPNVTSLFDERAKRFRGDPDLFDQIVQQSKTPPDIDVSMEGITPVLNTSNTLNQTGSTAPLLGDASIAQQKEFFERAIRGNVAGVPNRIGEIYQNLLDSGALSTTEALQYGSFVRNLPPPSNTYGLNPNIKPGIEGINLEGNFPGVL